MTYYAITLLVYFGTDLLACWGLNLEFGIAGVANLGYIVLVAAGGYTYAVLTLGPSSGNGGFQTYIVAQHWSPGFAILVAALVGAVLGALLGLSGLRRVRQDYQALVLLVAVVLASTVVSANGSLFNGDQGLALIPHPVNAGWSYVWLVGAVTLAGYLVLRKFSGGAYGRKLRAIRDNEGAAIAIGKDVVRARLVVQAVGGALGALSGALLVGFIGAWSPSAWQYLETLALLTAIIVGGRGNDGGVLVGTALIPVLLLQGVQFLPAIPGHPGLGADFSIIGYSLITIGFLFLRPQGVIKERRRRVAAATLGRRGDYASPVVDSAPTQSGFSSHMSQSLRRERRGPALRLVGLSRSYGGVRAVNDVSLEVQAGSITGVIGPNGAGKSTLLSLLCGASAPDAGRIEFFGTEITRAAPRVRARLGIGRSFQVAQEFSRLTTIENLMVAAPSQRGEQIMGLLLGKSYWGGQERELARRSYQLLEYFSMEHQADVDAGELSGGQKRILEFVRALMTQPAVLLLDEPLAGMSPLMADRFVEACKELQRMGMTILLIEHDLNAIERLCDRVVVMAQGKVLTEGVMAELRLDAEVQDAYLIG